MKIASEYKFALQQHIECAKHLRALQREETRDRQQHKYLSLTGKNRRSMKKFNLYFSHKQWVRLN